MYTLLQVSKITKIIHEHESTVRENLHTVNHQKHFVLIMLVYLCKSEY